MFRASNPYEEPVAKATDENLTSENWELNLFLCDKLASNKEADARQCLMAIQKRVMHRNANVQLYALTLADTLSKNCGDAVHHEIASRAFMQTIIKVVRDRSTHKIVKQRALKLLKAWADEYKNDDTLGLVADTVHDLREECTYTSLIQTTISTRNLPHPQYQTSSARAKRTSCSVSLHCRWKTRVDTRRMLLHPRQVLPARRALPSQVTELGRQRLNQWRQHRSHSHNLSRKRPS